MIKNIIFDVGRVLVGYDGTRAIKKFVENEEDQKLLNLAIFASAEWNFLDMGVMSEEMALGRMLSRIPNRLWESAFLIYSNWQDYCMWPLEEMREVVKELKQDGFHLYILSNAPVRMIECAERIIPGIEYFDGIVFSAAEKCIKPQKQIYETLLDRYHLDPTECFFIDDVPMNIEGAAECGVLGYCHADGDVEKLKGILKKLK